MNELAKVVAAFDAKPKGDGRTFQAECPTCHHRALAINVGRRSPYTLWCFRCEGANQKELAKLAAEAAQGSGPAADLTKVKPLQRKAWSEKVLLARLEAAEQALAGHREAQAFLASRGIDMATAQAFRLGFRNCYHAARIAVPYFDSEFGGLYQLRYRALVVPMKDGAPDEEQKWKAEKRELGYRRLFNLPLLMGWDPDDTRPLLVTESEIDAIMVVGLGVDAASVDSAKHHLVDADLALLKQVRNLVLAFDQDEDGQKCTTRFKSQLPHARVLGGYGTKDLGDLRISIGPAQFERRLNNFLERLR